MEIQQAFIKTFGVLLGITSMILSTMWFDWRLALVIFIAIWGNNLCSK